MDIDEIIEFCDGLGEVFSAAEDVVDEIADLFDIF